MIVYICEYILVFFSKSWVCLGIQGHTPSAASELGPTILGSSKGAVAQESYIFFERFFSSLPSSVRDSCKSSHPLDLLNPNFLLPPAPFLRMRRRPAAGRERRTRLSSAAARLPAACRCCRAAVPPRFCAAAVLPVAALQALLCCPRRAAALRGCHRCCAARWAAAGGTARCCSRCCVVRCARARCRRRSSPEKKPPTFLF